MIGVCVLDCYMVREAWRKAEFNGPKVLLGMLLSAAVPVEFEPELSYKAIDRML